VAGVVIVEAGTPKAISTAVMFFPTNGATVVAVYSMAA
jgi:hypothetical protein